MRLRLLPWSKNLVPLVTARHLSLANALDTPAGQLALLLAWAMESPYQSGSGVAALSKELTRVMQIIEGEQVTRDPLDELQARRVRNGRCGLASAVASSRQKLNEYPTDVWGPGGKCRLLESRADAVIAGGHAAYRCV